MALRRYEPWGLINELSRELGRMYEGQANGDVSSPATSDWVPSVDIREEEGRYVIEADLPGVQSDDIDVNMENGLLTIRGSRTTESVQSGNGYKRVERATGTFHRRFSLPDTAHAERISARCENGVLQVVIPKQAQVQPRRIKVES